MTLYLIRGLPGSGKSTLARVIANATGAYHAEADKFFGESYAFDPKKLPEAHAFCQRSAQRYLDLGIHVVVSNTFTTRAEMQPYREMAQALGAEVQEITCKGPWKSIHNVPDETIERMRARWEE
jgi:predicted kinase